MAFNFRCLNQVQLAIDVGMNDFQYFLTTQLGTSGQKKLNRFTVVKFAKLYAFVEMRWTCRFKTGESTLNTSLTPLLFPPLCLKRQSMSFE